METKKKKTRRERRARIFSECLAFAAVTFIISIGCLFFDVFVAICILAVSGFAVIVAGFFHDNPEGWEDVHWPSDVA